MRERTVSTARTPHTEWLANESLWCEGMHNTKHWRMNMVRFGMALHTTIVCEGLATWNIWQLQWPILPLLCRSSENGHGGGCCHLPHATYTHMTHDRIIHYFYDKIRVCAITSFVVWINAFVWHSHHTHTQHNIHARCAVNPKTQSYEWIKFILCVLCVVPCIYQYVWQLCKGNLWHKIWPGGKWSRAGAIVSQRFPDDCTHDTRCLRCAPTKRTKNRIFKAWPPKNPITAKWHDIT